MSTGGAHDRVIVGQKASAIHFVFGFLTVVGAVALVRGHRGAETTTGRIVADAILGGFVVAVISAWEYTISYPIRLEVTAQMITLVGRNGSRTEPLRRGDGELYFLMTGSAKTRTLMLCGGDAPGLNSVIRSATLAALQRGWEVIGIRDGFNGLMFPEDYVESGGTITLTREFVRGTGHLGGTVMGSTIRGNPCAYPVQLDDGSGGTVDRTDELVGLFREAGIEALITIGGDGSLAIGQRLSEAGLRVVGVPKTIDNDLLMTDATFGFDTAVGVATESIDRLFTTATSHSRVFVVEVMGRYAGWIALNAGMAARAHALVASTTEPRATVKGADNLAIERKSGRRNGYARYRQLRPVAHLAP